MPPLPQQSPPAAFRKAPRCRTGPRGKGQSFPAGRQALATCPLPHITSCPPHCRAAPPPPVRLMSLHPTPPVASWEPQAHAHAHTHTEAVQEVQLLREHSVPSLPRHPPQPKAQILGERKLALPWVQRQGTGRAPSLNPGWLGRVNWKTDHPVLPTCHHGNKDPAQVRQEPRPRETPPTRVLARGPSISRNPDTPMPTQSSYWHP